MISATISPRFLMLTFAVFGVAGTSIFGIQVGDAPFVLTILCPEGGNSCLFNFPGVRKKFRNLKVRSQLVHESSQFNFTLQWDPPARVTYTDACRELGIFSNMQDDGLSYVEFDVDLDEARVATSVSEDSWTVVPSLNSEEAKKLCDKLGCM